MSVCAASAGSACTACETGCTGKILVSPAYYISDVIGAVRRKKAYFSVTVPMNIRFKTAIGRTI